MSDRTTGTNSPKEFSHSHTWIMLEGTYLDASHAQNGIETPLFHIHAALYSFPFHSAQRKVVVANSKTAAAVAAMLAGRKWRSSVLLLLYSSLPTNNI